MADSRFPNGPQAGAPPPNKYDLPEEGQKTGLLNRLSVVLLISGVFVLLKDVLFDWGGQAGARADGGTNIDPGNKNAGPPSLVLLDTPQAIDQGTLEQKPRPDPNRADPPTAPIDSLSTEEAIYAIPVDVVGSPSAPPFAATNDNQFAGQVFGSTGPVVGSNVNDLAPQVGSGIAGSGRISGGGGFDGNAQSGDDAATDALRPTGNRAPVVTRPARLNNTLVNQTVIIGAAGLLQNAADADADVLTIENLVASSGNLVETGAGTWSFTPYPNDTTEVTFTYNVTDGTASTPQTAMLDLLPSSSETSAGTDAPDAIIPPPSSGVIDTQGGVDTEAATEGKNIINGSDGDDRILGTDGDDAIFGGAGDDTIFAGAGDDAIFGGDGNDTLSGGDGNDVILGENGQDVVIAGAGDDVVEGGAGDDHFLATVSDGDDSYSGGSGADTYDLFGTQADATVDLASGTATSSQTGHDSLLDIENVIGGAGDDTIVGSDGDNIIQGGLGSDEIKGGAGDDQFIATVSDGDDSYSGGSGADTYDLSGTQADATVDLASGTATSSQTGHDSILDIENVIGGAGDDTIDGSDGDNVFKGGAGSDQIEGGAGDDQFIATDSDGDDSYSGGSGTDTYDLSGTQAGVVVDLAQGTADGAEIGHDSVSGIEKVVGGAGDDVFKAGAFLIVFTGAEGNDIFDFGGVLKAFATGLVRDKITDFHVGDKIDLSEFDGNLMVAGNQDLELVADKLEFSDTGKVGFRFEGFGEDERTVVEVNMDDNAEFEAEIELHGRHDLTKDDFIGVS